MDNAEGMSEARSAKLYVGINECTGIQHDIVDKGEKYPSYIRI
jgi:hypothetical protein